MTVERERQYLVCIAVNQVHTLISQGTYYMTAGHMLYKALMPSDPPHFHLCFSPSTQLSGFPSIPVCTQCQSTRPLLSTLAPVLPRLGILSSAISTEMSLRSN